MSDISTLIHDTTVWLVVVLSVVTWVLIVLT